MYGDKYILTQNKSTQSVIEIYGFDNHFMYTFY